MRKLALTVAVLGLAAMTATAATPSPQDVLRLVPPSAQVVIAMDIAALRSHPLVQSWLLAHQAHLSGIDPALQEFLRDAGLDPLRDVDTMLVAMTPGHDGKPGLAIFGGRYDPSSLGAALVRRGATAITVGGVAAFRLPQHEGQTNTSPLLVAAADEVMIGDEVSLAAALAPTGAINSLVQGELVAGRLDPKSTFWVVAEIPQRLREKVAAESSVAKGQAPEQIEGVLRASGTLKRVTIMAALTEEELELSGFALADGPENAELLRDAIKGALAAVRLEAQDRAPELVEVLRDVKVSLDGAEVQASGVIPVSLIEKLARESEHPCQHPQAPRT